MQNKCRHKQVTQQAPNAHAPNATWLAVRKTAAAALGP